jgi:murein DD-endopeptidase MepM/ murein hydrolase activator NlpD
MSDRRERSKKSARKYNILLVPEGESRRSHSFRVTVLGVFAAVLASLILIVGAVVAILVYTPVGTVITIPNPHMEERYIAELMQVQERLNSVTDDVLFMREYNLQLRRALGEDISSLDTNSVAVLSDRREVRRQDVAAPGLQTVEQQEYDTFDASEDYGILGLTGGPVRVSSGVDARFRPTLPISLPADGYVTQRFDAGIGHVGIDIAGKLNTPISAVADGTVIFSGWTYHDGNMVIVSHGGGYFSVYKHNQSNLVRQGAVIRRGETIALLGNTGKHSYGPHLHFELWKDGMPLDPSFYLFDAKETL